MIYQNIGQVEYQVLVLKNGGLEKLSIGGFFTLPGAKDTQKIGKSPSFFLTSRVLRNPFFIFLSRSSSFVSHFFYKDSDTNRRAPGDAAQQIGRGRRPNQIIISGRGI